MQASKLDQQYVKDEDDKPPGVFITGAEFESILDDLKELKDIKAADAFESRPNKEFVPLRQAVDEIKSGLVK